MAISFTGKVAIVTGAGNGIGREHALELARRGAKVIVNDLGGSRDGSGSSVSAAQAVVDEIKKQGGEALANTDSVADEAAAKRMVETAMNAWGRLDIVICNAGILRDKSFAKATMADFRLIMDVHVMGSVYLAHAAWPIMRQQNYGRIVFTTSTSGLFGNFGQANYSTAKMAVVGLMNTLRYEGQKNNVYVNCIAPIATTRLTTDILPPDVQNKYPPHLVTPGVLYLCSEQAPNGIILQAAGGRFYLAEIVENQGVDLGKNATVEDVAAHFAKITDMTGAKPKDKTVGY